MEFLIHRRVVLRRTTLRFHVAYLFIPRRYHARHYRHYYLRVTNSRPRSDAPYDLYLAGKVARRRPKRRPITTELRSYAGLALSAASSTRWGQRYVTSAQERGRHGRVSQDGTGTRRYTFKRGVGWIIRKHIIFVSGGCRNAIRSSRIVHMTVVPRKYKVYGDTSAGGGGPTATTTYVPIIRSAREPAHYNIARKSDRRLA